MVANVATGRIAQGIGGYNLPQEPVEDESVDFAFGYLAGAGAASYGVGISEEQRAVVAVCQYRRASRSFILDKDRYIDGWIRGYIDYTTPILVVLVVGG